MVLAAAEYLEDAVAVLFPVDKLPAVAVEDQAARQGVDEDERNGEQRARKKPFPPVLRKSGQADGGGENGADNSENPERAVRPRGRDHPETGAERARDRSRGVEDVKSSRRRRRIVHDAARACQ